MVGMVDRRRTHRHTVTKKMSLQKTKLVQSNLVAVSKCEA